MEATCGFAHNFVTLGPRRILMPAGRPVSEASYRDAGVECHTVAVDELIKAAGEIENTGRNLPRALAGGVLIVCAVYLIVNAAFLYVLPLDEMAGSSLVAADAATRVFGSVGRSIVAALVMLSTFGALHGPMMTHPRIFYAMAHDGFFFKRIGAVHPRFQTPHASIVLTAALGIAYVWSRTFEQLARANILGIWPFYALSVGAVFLLCRSPSAPPAPYRTIGYPIVPVLFLLASLAMIGNSLVRQPRLTLFGFGIILSGVPVYYVWKRVKGVTEHVEPKT